MIVDPGIIVWADCEMTGLDLEKDELVEIAVLVTDANLKILDKGIQLVIKPTDGALAGMSEFVKEMHEKSGLLQELSAGLSLAEAEWQIIAYLKKFLTPGIAPLGGNSIGTDRAFIRKYMPEMNGFLHYRNIDVSTVKELARRWAPDVLKSAPEKAGGHRALDDIRESIAELEHYRANFFAPRL